MTSHKAKLVSLNIYVDNLPEAIEFFEDSSFHIENLEIKETCSRADMKLSAKGKFMISVFCLNHKDCAGRVTLSIQDRFDNGIKGESEIDLVKLELLQYHSDDLNALDELAEIYKMNEVVETDEIPVILLAGK
jgi:hypothetical protein